MLRTRAARDLVDLPPVGHGEGPRLSLDPTKEDDDPQAFLLPNAYSFDIAETKNVTVDDELAVEMSIVEVSDEKKGMNNKHIRTHHKPGRC